MQYSSQDWCDSFGANCEWSDSGNFEEIANKILYVEYERKSVTNDNSSKVSFCCFLSNFHT